MNSKEPISCDLHDYVEMACLYRYRVRVTQRDGKSLTATAANTRTESGVDYLVLKNGTQASEISMHDIAVLTVLTPNAKFSTIHF